MRWQRRRRRPRPESPLTVALHEIHALEDERDWLRLNLATHLRIAKVAAGFDMAAMDVRADEIAAMDQWDVRVAAGVWATDQPGAGRTKIAQWITTQVLKAGIPPDVTPQPGATT